jgi:tRNA G10  N-methylase Trm11
MSSKEGDLVVDPMCGSGVLLAVSGKMRRRVLGFDIAPEMVRFSNALLGRHGCVGKAEVADARDIPVEFQIAQMIVTSVPAWQTVAYSQADGALEAKSKTSYWLDMRQIVGEFKRILKRGGTCLLVQSPAQASRLITLAREADLPAKFVIVPEAK